ncbi:MAG: hypothetical protein ACLFQ6_01630 [Candidatus Sumerlaeia bacterium]
MKFFKKLFVFLTGLLLFCIGLYQILQMTLPADMVQKAKLWLREYLEFVMPMYLWWILLFALAAILPLLALYLALRAQYKKDYLILKTSSGQPLKIRSEAVTGYIRDELMQLPFVKKVPMTCSATRGALVINANIWIETTGQFSNMQDVILARAQSAAEDGLGIARIADIDINFESVRLIKNSKKAKQLEMETQKVIENEDNPPIKSVKLETEEEVKREEDKPMLPQPGAAKKEEKPEKHKKQQKSDIPHEEDNPGDNNDSHEFVFRVDEEEESPDAPKDKDKKSGGGPFHFSGN